MTHAAECSTCHGNGEVGDNPSPIRDPQCAVEGTCPDCHGTGVDARCSSVSPTAQHRCALGSGHAGVHRGDGWLWYSGTSIRDFPTSKDAPAPPVTARGLTHEEMAS